jgi:hypothetical protein
MEDYIAAYRLNFKLLSKNVNGKALCLSPSLRFKKLPRNKKEKFLSSYPLQALQKERS